MLWHESDQEKAKNTPSDVDSCVPFSFSPLQNTQLIINVKSAKIKPLSLQVLELFAGGIFVATLEILQHVHETDVCIHICLNSFGHSLKFSPRPMSAAGQDVLQRIWNSENGFVDVQPAAKRIYKINIRQWVTMNSCILTKGDKKKTKRYILGSTCMLWPKLKIFPSTIPEFFSLTGIKRMCSLSDLWTFQPLLKKVPSKCSRDNILTQMG